MTDSLDDYEDHSSNAAKKRRQSIRDKLSLTKTKQKKEYRHKYYENVEKPKRKIQAELIQAAPAAAATSTVSEVPAAVVNDVQAAPAAVATSTVSAVPADVLEQLHPASAAVVQDVQAASADVLHYVQEAPVAKRTKLDEVIQQRIVLSWPWIK